MTAVQNFLGHMVVTGGGFVALTYLAALAERTLFIEAGL